jgi:hypothetical protein
MAKKLSKDDEKTLRIFASDLPMVMNATMETHVYTGAELIEMELVEKGVKVDPDQLYPYNMPVQIASNHYRQLKRAWLKHGQDGLTCYLKGIRKLIEEQNIEV